MCRFLARLPFSFLILLVLNPAPAQERADKPGQEGPLVSFGAGYLRHHKLKSIVFSPDGKSLASAGDHFIRIWDVASGRLLREFYGWGDSVAIAPDGKMLATLGGSFVALVDFQTGKEIRRLQGEKGRYLDGVAFSPDGKFLYSNSGGVRLGWHVTTGKITRGSRVSQPTKSAIAISLWEAIHDRKYPEIDLPRERSVDRQDGHVAGNLCVTASSAPCFPQHLPTVIHCWDLQTGEQLRHWVVDKKARVYSLEISADGKRLATGTAVGANELRDGAVQLWDLDTGKELWRAQRVRGVTMVRFSPDGKLLAAGEFEGRFSLWNVASGEQVHAAPGWEDTVRSIAFSPDERTLATVSGGELGFWRWKTGNSVNRLDVDPDARVFFSPDLQQFAVIEPKGGFEVREAPYGKVLQRFGGSQIVSVAFAHNGDSLVFTDVQEGKVESYLWTRREGKTSLPLKFDHAAFSPDDKTLALAQNNRIALRDMSTRKVTAECGIPFERGFSKLAFSADGKTLAAGGSDRSIRLFDTRNGALLRELKGHQHHVHDVAFSPDGTRLASACMRWTVRLWDPATGKEQRAYSENQGARCFALSPSGRFLALGHNNGTATVWDLGPQKE